MDLKSIVEVANANAQLMDGTTHPVEAIVANSEVVFAVWQDREATDGVSFHIIKGVQRMKAIAAGTASANVKWTAVPVVDREYAIAAGLSLGREG
jgi:hypothetical protein